CASHLSDATGGIRRLFEADDVGVDDFQRYMDTASDTARLIQANCERAAELIRSFKQVAVDRTTSDRRRFDLAASIGETLAALGPSLRQAGHAVAVSCPAGLVADTYPGALSQVLTNFVMNSVVHGYDEGVSGRLTITVDQPDPATVRLVYSDDGKGIPEENRNRVFDPFFTTRRGSGGTGLGLHIAHNLVRGSLGGTLTVDSALGHGSTFTLIFPLVAEEGISPD
ncbi:MAG: HAMP domain-containing sensor histidine kinase, partial [Pseudomonadota bacterium]